MQMSLSFLAVSLSRGDLTAVDETVETDAPAHLDFSDFLDGPIVPDLTSANAFKLTSEEKPEESPHFAKSSGASFADLSSDAPLASVTDLGSLDQPSSNLRDRPVSDHVPGMRLAVEGVPKVFGGNNEYIPKTTAVEPSGQAVQTVLNENPSQPVSMSEPTEITDRQGIVAPIKNVLMPTPATRTHKETMALESSLNNKPDVTLQPPKERAATVERPEISRQMETHGPALPISVEPEKLKTTTEKTNGLQPNDAKPEAENTGVESKSADKQTQPVQFGAGVTPPANQGDNPRSVKAAMRESRFSRVGSVEQAPKADIQNNPLPAKSPTAVSQMTTIDHSREPNAFIAEPTAELPVIGEKEPGPQMRGADSVRSDPVVRNVVSQVVMAVQKVQADGFIELRLQPEELGRIRMTMLQTENGMMVQVAAEKPETLELFRRNIEQLEIDMKREGFSNLSFDFGQTQQNDHDGPDHTEPDDEPSNSTAEINTRITVHQMYRPITDGRVDIRI